MYTWGFSSEQSTSSILKAESAQCWPDKLADTVCRAACCLSAVPTIAAFQRQTEEFSWELIHSNWKAVGVLFTRNHTISYFQHAGNFDVCRFFFYSCHTAGNGASLGLSDPFPTVFPLPGPGAVCTFITFCELTSQIVCWGQSLGAMFVWIFARFHTFQQKFQHICKDLQQQFSSFS